MIIIGGLGSIFGSFAGAAFHGSDAGAAEEHAGRALGWPTDLAAHLEFIIVGALIVDFLIAEPHGLAQLWRSGEGETETLAVSRTRMAMQGGRKPRLR